MTIVAIVELEISLSSVVVPLGDAIPEMMDGVLRARLGSAHSVSPTSLLSSIIECSLLNFNSKEFSNLFRPLSASTTVVVILIFIFILSFSSRNLDNFREFHRQSFLEQLKESPHRQERQDHPLQTSICAEECFVPEQYCVKKKIEDGVNGVYFVAKNTDPDNVYGVFKPRDEEAFAPLNEKKRVGEIGSESPLKKGIIVGDAMNKEIAAYRLDHAHFARVPKTEKARVVINPGASGEPKEGSLQAFVPNVGSSEDFSSSKFSVRDVHAIGLLDLRIMNTDRHTGNLLVENTQDYRLVPIDHGYSLPDFRNLSDAWFDWVSWNQADEPFSPEMCQYIENIDIWSDAQLLIELGIRPASVMTYLISSEFVKTGVKRRWTLRRLALAMSRDIDNPETPSALESLIQECLARNEEIIPLLESNEFCLSNACIREFVQAFSLASLSIQ